MSIDLSCPDLQPEHHTYSETFLMACPVCKTVKEKLRIHLNKKVTCAQCTSIFTAHENVIDVECSFSDTISPQVRPPEEREVNSKERQEGEAHNFSDEKQQNDFARPKSPIDYQRESKNLRKEALRKLLAKRKGNIEVDAERISSKAPNKVTSGIQGKEVMENEGQHNDKEGKEKVMENKEHYTDKSVESYNGLTKLGQNDAKVSQKEMSIFIHGSKGATGGTKSEKGKCGANQGLSTSGVALWKAHREKKRVRSYSPSRECTFRKKAKLGLEKGGEADDDERIISKKKIKKDISKGGKVKKLGQDLWKSKGKGFPAQKGKEVKNRSTPEEKDDIVKSDPERFSNEFKLTMTEEIRRQVLDGLGEASKDALGDIQVVDVEEIHPCMSTTRSIPDTEGVVMEDRRYIAKVKLMTTLFFPLTLRASQEPPQKLQDPMRLHESHQSRAPEEHESKGIEELTEQEFKGREDTEKHEFKGLEEPEEGLQSEELSHGLPLENENREELDVPESEFYDFECDRSEDKFADGQVWASYDSKDGMPRDYVQIKKVMSMDPFNVQVALLKPIYYSAPLKAGDSLACGDYCTDDRLRIMNHINAFSHIMKWKKGYTGMIGIYPEEGEVWALYKDWKEIESLRRIKSGYEIVQVVGIKKDCMVSVMPLVNYGGYRTLFTQQAEMEPFQIPKQDFIRFSHQIPTYELLGTEGLDGHLELDPASIPL